MNILIFSDMFELKIDESMEKDLTDFLNNLNDLFKREICQNASYVQVVTDPTSRIG